MFLFGKKKNPGQLFYYTDLHAHILPGIDDGAPDTGTAIELLRHMQSWGITRVYATPHVVGHVFENTPASIEAAYRLLQKEAEQQGLDIEIRYSAEYRMDDNFHRIVAEECSELISLPGNHLLVENSFRQPAFDLEELLFRLKLKGFSPILAHPERYAYYHYKKEVYQHLHNSGCLFQINLLSLAGYYGKEPKEIALWLCKNGLVDFLGSDLHNLEQAQAINEWISGKECRQLSTKLAKIKNDSF